MIEEISFVDGAGKARTHSCKPEVLRAYCMANIECLLKIALADTDAHIEKLGGEMHIIELIKQYDDLAKRMYIWEQLEKGCDDD